ncbi:MAG: sugar phosphorylase [Spirochaetales bacterium]|nr:sugar phosphorylase [Spirochaetales bacterium]
MSEKIRCLIEDIYGAEKAQEVYQRLSWMLENRLKEITPPSVKGAGSLPVSEEDAFVITYGDQFRKAEAEPLAVLGQFADRYLRGLVSGIHILPFFPYTSDDGFSVVDYRAVNPAWGTWKDIQAAGGRFRLMSDLVLNHCSASSPWFKAFLRGEEPYGNYFITVDEGTDLSMVARPRALPLLTPFHTSEGKKHVWTTFSADQVDLNFACPEVLLEMIDVFLFHVRQGIQVIRLDAIAYLWKEIGHSCLHHAKTHAVVKLFRALVDEYLPWVIILTETNVPHKENISYFGDGTDEAHMVYQFSLPPLVLDAFLRQDAGHLRTWAGTLPPPDGKTTFFNFLASHDGVGVLPAQGILSEEEIEQLIGSVKNRGGLISYKATAAGKIPYEMNVNYLDAVAEASLPKELRAKKFLAAQAFLLIMPGVPGIYIHSVIGSGNWLEGVEQTGMNRTINRQKLDLDTVAEELDRPGSLRNLVYNGYASMLRVRRTRKAFHPGASFRVLPAAKGVFAAERISPDRSQRLVCMINTSLKDEECRLPTVFNGTTVVDILSSREITLSPQGSIPVPPLGVLWVEPL